MAGYAVECGLKACIAKGTRRHEFPEKRRVDSSYSHNLRELIKVAGLSDAFAEHVRTDPDFRSNWEVVQAWSEQSRYEKHRSETAAELLEAIVDRRHGAISWIKLHW